MKCDMCVFFAFRMAVHRKRWGVSVFLVLVVLACFPTGVVGGKSDGRSCSSSSQCNSRVCRGGNCCGSKGRSTGCTDCDSYGHCSTCSSGYIKSSDKCLKSDGGSCSSSSQCMPQYWVYASSGVCRGGNCCGPKGRSTGCTDCDSDGDCSTCSSGYTKKGGSRGYCSNVDSIVGVAVPSYVGVVVLLAAIAGFVWCIRRRNAAKKARKGGTSAITPRASSEMMQAQVPVGISPGMQFQVKLGQQIVAVACPQGAGPGSMIPIQTPVQPVVVVSLVEALPSREMTRQVSAAQVVPVDRPQSTNLDVEQIVIDVHVTNPALGRTSSTSSRTGIPNDVIEGNAEAEKKKCPQGHDLTLHTTEGDRGTCDGCSRSLDHGTKILNCIQCDFFLCNHCDPRIDASELSGGGRTRGSSESKSSTLQQPQQQGHYSLPGRRFLSVIEGKTVTVITVPSRAAIPCLGPESYTPWLNDTPICTPTAEPVVEKQKTWSVGLVLLAIVFFPITLVVLPILGVIGLQGMLCPNEDLGSAGCCNEAADGFECCHGCCCDDDGNCECECDGE